jgi:hypothetical protein
LGRGQQHGRPQRRVDGKTQIASFTRRALGSQRPLMMSFICSCRNKIGAELHKYLEEGMYHKRLFRGPSTNDMKK